MTEQEYIDATNLAKIRAARTILYDALAMTGKEKAWQAAIMRSTRDWEAHLEKIVKCAPESPDPTPAGNSTEG